MHHSKFTETSEYADKRYFQAYSDNDVNPNLSSSHKESRRVASNTQVHRSHLQNSEADTDERSLNNAQLQDMRPPRHPQNSCERNAYRFKQKAWVSGSHPIQAPEVNRSLKPQKLALQVKDKESNMHGSYHEKVTHHVQGNNETCLSFQSHTFPPRSCGEKIEAAMSRGSNSQRAYKDQSKDKNLIAYPLPRTCNDSPHRQEMETKHITSTSTQRPYRRHFNRTTQKEQAEILQAEISRITVSLRPTKPQNAPRKPSVWTAESPAKTRHEGDGSVLHTTMVCRPQKQEKELDNILIDDFNKMAMKGEEAKASNWYLKEYNRNNAEHILYEENKDGVFLVRDNSHSAFYEPYILSIYYENKVYHIKIRYMEDSQQYALGTGLRGNYKFCSVEEMIEYHRKVPLLLVDGKSQKHYQGQQCFLTRPPLLADPQSQLPV